MNRKTKAFVLLGMLSVWTAHGQTIHAMDQPITHSYVPHKGFIPDEATAAAVAEAILIPIYGKNVIEKQKPFNVKLTKNVFLIKIDKTDGRVLHVTHSR